MPLIREPDPGDLLMRIESPPFDAPPPDLVHAERIPPDIAHACAASRQGRFEARPVSVWLLHDVVVACEGLVFDQTGALFRPSITQHGDAEIEWASARIRDGLPNAEVPVLDGPLVLGKKRGAFNYGHWLMEMLPRLHLVLERLRDPAICVLLHDIDDARLGEVIRTSLNRLGVADHRVRVSGAAPVRVRCLILVEGLSEHGVYLSPLVRDCHRRLATGIDGVGAERVFIARGPGRGRDFAAAAHLEAVAQSAGYAVLRPDRCSFIQQIAALRDARVVAGAMGAAMTSLAFMRMPGRALVFAGADMPDTFFWFVATLFGHRYREVRCRQAGSVDGAAFYDRPLLIEEAEFRDRLRAA